MARSNFDALLEEIGVFKAMPLDTDEDDDRIAAAAGEDDDEQDDDERLVEVLRVMRKLVGVVTAQGVMITAMRAELDRRPVQGGGAKPLTKAHELDGESFMAKALSAQAAGRISGVQVAIAEAHLNVKKQPPADIVRAVMGDA